MMRTYMLIFPLAFEGRQQAVRPEIFSTDSGMSQLGSIRSLQDFFSKFGVIMKWVIANRIHI